MKDGQQGGKKGDLDMLELFRSNRLEIDNFTPLFIVRERNDAPLDENKSLFLTSKAKDGTGRVVGLVRVKRIDGPYFEVVAIGPILDEKEDLRTVLQVRKEQQAKGFSATVQSCKLGDARMNTRLFQRPKPPAWGAEDGSARAAGGGPSADRTVCRFVIPAPRHTLEECPFVLNIFFKFPLLFNLACKFSDLLLQIGIFFLKLFVSIFDGLNLVHLNLKALSKNSIKGNRG